MLHLSACAIAHTAATIALWTDPSVVEGPDLSRCADRAAARCPLASLPGGPDPELAIAS